MDSGQGVPHDVLDLGHVPSHAIGDREGLWAPGCAAVERNRVGSARPLLQPWGRPMNARTIAIVAFVIAVIVSIILLVRRRAGDG
jgi:hypothetical protein